MAGDLEAENQRLRSILTSIAPDKIPGPFICGQGGEQGTDGLHERYQICATYGSDVVAVYERVRTQKKGAHRPPSLSLSTAFSWLVRS